MSDGTPVPGSIYFYAPNRGAAVFFVAAFAASGGLHLAQCIKYKAFKVTGLYPFTCLLFVVGFALRHYGAYHWDDVNIYIASNSLIYMSPPIVELANYHILGRILYYIPYYAPIHPGRVLTTFGTLSFIVEVLNGLGVAWMVNPSVPEDIAHVGEALLKASLIIQLAVVCLFVALVAAFQHRCSRRGGTLHARRIRVPVWSMYASSFLILVRCVYRTVEYFSDTNMQRRPGLDPMSLSPVVRYEWFFYVFEASVMLLNTALWNALYPRRWLPEKYNTYLAEDGVTEIDGGGYKDNRSFLITLLDPFGWFLKSNNQSGQRPGGEANGFAKNERGSQTSGQSGPEAV